MADKFLNKNSSKQMKYKTGQASSVAKKVQKKQILANIAKVEEIQKGIDTYNEKLLTEPIDSRFEELAFSSDTIIVKLYKEAYIKGFTLGTHEILDDNGNVVKEVIKYPMYGYTQIDGRRRTSDDETYVETPLPYLYKGKICGMSKMASQKLLDTSGVEFNVGDIVNINEIILKDRRYYLQKDLQVSDNIVNQIQHNLTNFEGYFKLSPYDIESKCLTPNSSKYRTNDTLEVIDIDALYKNNEEESK